MFSLLCLRGQLSDSGGTPGSVPRASPQGSCEPNVVPPRWTEVYRASRGPTSVSGRRAGRIDQVTLYLSTWKMSHGGNGRWDTLPDPPLRRTPTPRPQVSESPGFRHFPAKNAAARGHGGHGRRRLAGGPEGASVAPDEQMGGQSHGYGQISDNRARLVERADPDQIAMDGKGDPGARSETQLSKRCE